MHLNELLACFALISCVLVCVILHLFLYMRGIYHEFGFGLAPLQLGIWIDPFRRWPLLHTFGTVTTDRIRIALGGSPTLWG